MWALLNRFAIGRILAWLGFSISTRKVQTWVRTRIGYLAGYLSSLSFWLFPGLWQKAYELMETDINDAAQVASGPAATIARSMTGLPIDAGALSSVLTGGLSADERDAIGAAFTAIFDDIFRVLPIAEGNRSRLPGAAEREAFERFIGRNAQLQMAGIMADLVKDRLPKGLTIGLGDMVERAEKIMGFEDSQEEIMEPLMEKLIITGLEKHYNRATKPTDLSAQDAVSGFIRQEITEQVMNAILDNEGIRDDIRPTLINLNAKNLTEADFRDLYQRGFWQRGDVFTAYRGLGFLAADAEKKTTLITQDREWTLRKELLNVWESQFVHGVITEASFRASLGTLYFSAVEEDLEVEIAKGKASMGGAAKPKKIAGSFNVAPWRVKDGASAVMSWNIRNADTITISGIGAVGPRGEMIIHPTASGTYTLDASNATDSAQFEAVVEVGGIVAPKPPGASLSAQPRNITMFDPVELRWSTTNADTVSIDGIGGVAEQGVMAVYPVLSTVYTLRASNAAGTTVRQDLVFVKLPIIGGGDQDRPAITFSITPSTVTPAQPQAELNWRITRADEGELTYPDGTKKAVNVNGAEIVRATASGIYTISAKNSAGETQEQEGLIFNVPALP